MVILIIMAIGIFIGYKYFNEKYLGLNGKIQILCTALLIFSMGVSLGSRPEFFSELKTLGFESVIFSLIPIICSIFPVYFLTKKFLDKKKETKK